MQYLYIVQKLCDAISLNIVKSLCMVTIEDNTATLITLKAFIISIIISNQAFNDSNYL